METKHTKGKWKIVDTPKYHDPNASTLEIHSDNNQGWICKIQNNGVIKNEEGFANAKLIAAAPDLLNCLLDIYNDREVWSELFESQQDYILRTIKQATQ